MSEGQNNVAGINYTANAEHRAPELVTVTGTLSPIESVVTLIHKQCKDYCHFESPYREKRCREIAMNAMKESNIYNLDYFQEEQFKLSAHFATQELLIGNLYTLVTLFGEVVKPWDWLGDSKIYEGQYATYTENPIAQKWMVRFKNNNTINFNSI